MWAQPTPQLAQKHGHHCTCTSHFQRDVSGFILAQSRNWKGRKTGGYKEEGKNYNEGRKKNKEGAKKRRKEQQGGRNNKEGQITREGQQQGGKTVMMREGGATMMRGELTTTWKGESARRG